jgi:hypothetical protein
MGAQAKALRNVHFSAVAVAKLEFCKSLCLYGIPAGAATSRHHSLQAFPCFKAWFHVGFLFRVNGQPPARSFVPHLATAVNGVRIVPSPGNVENSQWNPGQYCPDRSRLYHKLFFFKNIVNPIKKV